MRDLIVRVARGDGSLMAVRMPGHRTAKASCASRRTFAAELCPPSGNPAPFACREQAQAPVFALEVMEGRGGNRIKP
jgi:hypothetical protein